jgi:SP family facilitated glucose transporter-like MFS transporter 8
MDLKGNGSLVHIAALLAGAASSGLGLVYPSPASHSISVDLDLSKFELSLFSSLSQLASIFGPTLANYFLYSFGRRSAFRVILFICFLSWMVLVLSRLHRFFCIVHRFLFGLSIGGFFTIIPVYVMELSPVDKRSVYGTVPQFFMAAGGLLSNFVGSFLDWLNLGLFCSLFPAIGFWLSFLLPESPVSSHIPARNVSAAESLFVRVHHKSLTTGLFLFFFQQLSGINPIQVNLSRLLKSRFGPTIASSSKCIAGFFAIPLISCLGRQNSWNLSCIGCCIFLCLLAYAAWSGIEALSVCACFGSLFSFCLGLGPIPGFVIPELFSDGLRSSAVSFMQTFNCLFAFLLTFAYPYSGDAIGYPATIGIMALSMIGSVIFGINALSEPGSVSAAKSPELLIATVFESSELAEEL